MILFHFVKESKNGDGVGKQSVKISRAVKLLLKLGFGKKLKLRHIPAKIYGLLPTTYIYWRNMFPQEISQTRIYITDDKKETHVGKYMIDIKKDRDMWM